jgi:4-alpha-glucanotransferase
VGGGLVLDSRRRRVTAQGALPALHALAEYCGVEVEFEDARGATQSATPETLRAVLAAMGLEAQDEDQAHATLVELQAREWELTLPPVQVCVPTERPSQIEINVPQDTARIEWQIELEDGQKLTGSANAEELTVAAQGAARGVRLAKLVLPLPHDLPLGYHHFALVNSKARSSLIVSPGQCWLSEDGDARYWGFAAQLYTVKTLRSWGIGDFSDLGELFRLTSEAGGDVIGINPLHALFPSNPAHASPYSPSSRLLLNVLYIDVVQVPEFLVSPSAKRFTHSPAFQERMDRARASRWVDYPTVASFKLTVLHDLFSHFVAHAEPDRRADFEAFRSRRDESFELACVFQALSEHLTTTDPTMQDLARWPVEFAHAQAPGVAQFRAEHAARITELMWLQWIADEQLAAATRAGPGMKIGLYRDLAVGADASSAERWTKPWAFAGAKVGAPPDLFQAEGQSWGLPPPHPMRWREEGFASFIGILRANMLHAGALRIDHAMGLQHLYWIPEGVTPAEGAYVKYPLEELLAILALESHRQRCIVVGEDLGTVPRGFRERMERGNVLSYRVLFFERAPETQEFLGTESYPALSLAVAANHDLPTLLGWWRASSTTRADREQLCRRLGLPTSLLPDFDEVAIAVHDFLARTPSVMVLAQLDDLTREAEPVNKPGDAESYPNWRRRLKIHLEDLHERSLLGGVVEAMGKRRRRS